MNIKDSKQMVQNISLGKLSFLYDKMSGKGLSLVRRLRNVMLELSLGEDRKMKS